MRIIYRYFVYFFLGYSAAVVSKTDIELWKILVGVVVFYIGILMLKYDIYLTN